VPPADPRTLNGLDRILADAIAKAVDRAFVDR
jgi:hypothetical protein